MRTTVSVAAVVILVAAILPLQSRADLEEGLIGHWSFEGGSARDSSPYKHHGIKHSNPKVVDGVCGDALELDGLDDYIDLGNPPGLNPKTAMSLVAWYKPASFVGRGNTPIIDKGYLEHTPPFYQYHLGATGDLYGAGSMFETDYGADGTWHPLRTPTPFWTPGNWYHLVSTFDGSEIRFYVNGQLIASREAVGALTDWGSHVFLGKFTNISSNANLPGVIDEIRMYNRPLDESEILTLYQECLVKPIAVDIKPGSCPNPLSVTAFSHGDRGQGLANAVLPVAILGTAEFDVTDLNPSTIALEGISAMRWSIEDVGTPVSETDGLCECTDEGADGFDDLCLKFNRKDLIGALGVVLAGDELTLTLSAELMDGTRVEGTDCVVIKGRDETKAGASARAFGGPTGYLVDNHPNPFNPTTNIRFVINSPSLVRLEVLNALGQRVAVLVEGNLSAGEHTVEWNASDRASGVYFYRMSIDDRVETRKMVLLK